MKKLLSIILGLAATTFLATSCGSFSSATTSTPTVSINLSVDEPNPNRFVGLDYGIRLSFQDARSSDRVLERHDYYLTSTPRESVYPDVRSFVSESCRRYMRTLGFNLDADVSTDYIMNIKMSKFNLSYLSGAGWSGVVELTIEVFDHNRTMVYPSTKAVGRATISGGASDRVAPSAAMNKAYKLALEDIDWDRIAFFLKKASSPKLEANKSVTGEGNTALESTVIRWYVDSSPKGADVSWRVVSSTQDVKNTNANYVGSTPYETTETFDIKGLTYNNSGNVQIEVMCEKAGYITQKKRFNVRQAIDQKEISTKFNLIKEE